MSSSNSSITCNRNKRVSRNLIHLPNSGNSSKVRVVLSSHKWTLKAIKANSSITLIAALYIRRKKLIRRKIFHTSSQNNNRISRRVRRSSYSVIAQDVELACRARSRPIVAILRKTRVVPGTVIIHHMKQGLNHSIVQRCQWKAMSKSKLCCSVWNPLVHLMTC